MNTKAIRWAWKQPVDSEVRRVVLMSLAMLANNMGAIEASQNRICKEARVSRSTLIVHLNGLVDDGYIIRKSNYRKSGRRGVNTYYLTYGGSSRHLGKDSEEKQLEQEILGNPEEFCGLY